MTDFLAMAFRLADAARLETLEHAGGAQVDDKGGGDVFDPVTAGDRATERRLRDLIAAEYPDHGITGEEYPATPGAGRFEWSLDPIDGTRSYVCGLPTWTILIALLESGRPVIGIIDVPCLDERYIGCDGRAWSLSAGVEQLLEVSRCTDLAAARLSTTDPFLFIGSGADSFDKLRRSVRITRYGHDAYAYARLAAGTLDLVVECGLKPHDLNALIPVVRGAGGMFGDWRGGEDFTQGNVIAAATPQLFEAAVAIMSAPR